MFRLSTLKYMIFIDFLFSLQEVFWSKYQGESRQVLQVLCCPLGCAVHPGEVAPYPLSQGLTFQDKALVFCP